METKAYVESLLADAIRETEKVQSGQEFIVRDLFKGHYWKTISQGVRAGLGSSYYANLPQGVTSLGKTAQNQQIYRKD